MAFLFSHHTAVDAHGKIIEVPAKPLQAPEISPDAGLTAVLLLAGTLAVLVGRRRNGSG